MKSSRSHPWQWSSRSLRAGHRRKNHYPLGRDDRLPNRAVLSGEVSIAPVSDDAGICTHLVGSVHDITDRKRAEYADPPGKPPLNLMTSITRHDINNKISIITGYLAVAKKFTDPTLVDYFGKMRSAIKAIQTQIEFTGVYHDLGTGNRSGRNLERSSRSLMFHRTFS